MSNVTAIIELLQELSLSELSELKEIVKTQFGIDIQVSMSVSTSLPADTYRVILHNCGPQKINCIKIVRTVTGLGLKEAKDIAESNQDEVIYQGADLTQAMTMVKELRSIGSTASYEKE